MTYRYRVLGTTRAVRQDGTEVPLSGARLRALLSALAAAGGRVVGTGQLADQIWGEDAHAPADEVAALQALVGRVRRALGSAVVASAPGGYRLNAHRDDIDLFRFERLAAEGTAALGAGDARQAATVLDEALALWDGPALADLPGRDAHPRAVRAEQRHAEARRARLATDVARGRPEQALAGLAALAAGQPLDEPLHALRIRALRAAGRPAEALQAYEEIRTRLAERLGTGPGRELRALHAALLADDEPVPTPPAASTASAPEPASLPAPAGRAVPGNLRARLTSFVGREPELAALAAELPAARLITLTGPGGAGKTRLSLEAARAAAGAWPDGVWLAELAPVRDPAAVAETVLTALGARETVVRGPAAGDDAPRDPLTRLAEYCGPRRLLIVLDNCEQVIDAAAGLAETLLTGCPGVSVLATSREPLGVPGESVRTVGPLPQDMALQLLAERGAAARPGFRTADDPVACAEICHRLDGLPLAIELAAARLRAFEPRQLADRLDDRFRLLGAGSGARTVLPRQRTLRAVVDWSWELLTEGERAVLRRLSVFSGGCAPAEAEAVCGENGEDGNTLGLLASLIDKSLVVADPGGADGMRYRLLETVGEYAAERLDASGERAAVERRHLAAYRELARTGDPELRGPRQARLLRRFEREHDNLRTALRTAVDRGEEQEAICLVLSMSWFWQLRDHQPEARAWFTAAAALGPDPFLAPVRPAVPLTEPCTAIAPPWPEEQLWEARRGAQLLVLASGGEADVSEPDVSGPAWPGTPARLRAIVAAYRPGLPQICRQPGTMWFIAKLMVGDFPGIGAALDAQVRACRERGSGWDLGLALMLRAQLAGGRPDGAAGAARDADEALARFERAGDLHAIAQSLWARGELYEYQGRYEEAAADFARAMESCAPIGAYGQVPLFKARLASVRLESAGDPTAEQAAERLLVEAVEEAAEAAGYAEGTARLLLARRYGRTGRTDQARTQLRALEAGVAGEGAAREGAAGESAAAESAAFAEQPFLGGVVEGMHGWLDCLEGEFERARERTAQAVRRLDSLAYLVTPHLIIHQFPCAAWAKARLGAAEDAARLLGAYAHHLALPEGFRLGTLPSVPDTEILARAEAAVRAALDEATYARARGEGAGLPVKEAAALI
ncbi:winged helix-turn-helix domain-containing protein [Streptomyces scopuliridis]|uniref:Winged helix-turn-helix domain-containing protein n=1 Tax=Streptomyces scopuliridis TaxID=452529 RepID=A0ACD4ZDR1_9ACTN|nr:BTAD domain-containing putative transcriptional regulator [Streptomyces scopuliridis]WSB96447.1 winged helix-turn-helix domain-containing protein [Streptomyces scopuliridis]WSC09849.1 winged helix-turn-helix domain-containing protein [Streptomyces scopuliridis]